ncbi:uncharacterized protein LOC143177365 [Calliopsis andreniformis]|uniref:uncharacterized protein LOC143177365 n=1 Tax=Calliopsis andreniformis TaxID=337506 RepID=UPI003FCD243A
MPRSVSHIVISGWHFLHRRSEPGFDLTYARTLHVVDRITPVPKEIGTQGKGERRLSAGVCSARKLHATRVNVLCVHPARGPYRIPFLRETVNLPSRSESHEYRSREVSIDDRRDRDRTVQPLSLLPCPVRARRHCVLIGSATRSSRVDPRRVWGTYDALAFGEEVRGSLVCATTSVLVALPRGGRTEWRRKGEERESRLPRLRLTDTLASRGDEDRLVRLVSGFLKAVFSNKIPPSEPFLGRTRSNVRVWRKLNTNGLKVFHREAECSKGGRRGFATSTPIYSGAMRRKAEKANGTHTGTHSAHFSLHPHRSYRSRPANWTAG